MNPFKPLNSAKSVLEQAPESLGKSVDESKKHHNYERSVKPRAGVVSEKLHNGSSQPWAGSHEEN